MLEQILGIVGGALAVTYLPKAGMMALTWLPKPAEARIIDTLSLDDAEYHVASRIDDEGFLRPYEYQLICCHPQYNRVAAEFWGWEMGSYNYLYYLVNHERGDRAAAAFRQFFSSFESDVKKRGIRRIHADFYYHLVPYAASRGFTSSSLAYPLLKEKRFHRKVLLTLSMYKDI